MDNQEINFNELFKTEEASSTPEANEPTLTTETPQTSELPPQNVKKKFKYAVVPIIIVLVFALLASFFLFTVNDEKTYYCVVYHKNDNVYFHRTDTKKTVKLDIKSKYTVKNVYYYGFAANDPRKFLYAVIDKNNQMKLYYSVIDDFGES